MQMHNYIGYCLIAVFYPMGTCVLFNSGCLSKAFAVVSARLGIAHDLCLEQQVPVKDQKIRATR